MPILSPAPTILAEPPAEDGGDTVEIGDRVQVQVGEDTRVRVITLTADRHDPDLGIISVRHPAGAALLGAQEDEEIEFEFDNKLSPMDGHQDRKRARLSQAFDYVVRAPDFVSPFRSAARSSHPASASGFAGFV